MARAFLRRAATAVCGLACLLAASAPGHAQTFTQRGFIEASATWFAQDAPNDDAHTVVDHLVRQEVFVAPVPWLRAVAGADVRANTHEQVDARARLDVDDRGVKRPLFGVRRFSAAATHGPFTLEAGRQFIRWGKTDIVTPTDHFAPRDFINVVSSEFLAVTGVRAMASSRADTFDVVWVPWFTPSRMPLTDQRWTVLPPAAAGLTLRSLAPVMPERSQVGVRWSRNAVGYEWSASVFDGMNTMPDVVVAPGAVPTELLFMRRYPRLRAYGADLAAPNRWFTLKAEASVNTSPDAQTDAYVLYGVQAERQSGEWQLLAGYAGEHLLTRRVTQPFAPDRGLSQSIVARATYTVDTNRSVTVETAVRQNGHGIYVKSEFSRARGPHWRARLAGVAIAGRRDDFLGQYRRNSNLSLTLRYSY